MEYEAKVVEVCVPNDKSKVQLSFIDDKAEMHVFNLSLFAAKAISDSIDQELGEIEDLGIEIHF